MATSKARKPTPPFARAASLPARAAKLAEMAVRDGRTSRFVLAPDGMIISEKELDVIRSYVQECITTLKGKLK